MKKTAKIILVSAGAAMLMAGGVLGAVAVYDTANPRSSGDIVVKTEHVNLVWGEDGQHEQDKFEVAITDLNTTPTDRYLTVAIAPEKDHTLAAGTYKGTLAFSIASTATNSMILPKLAVEIAEDGTENKVSMGTDYKANLVVELTEEKTSALVKISYKLTENFGELTQEELTALAAEKLTATADWNIYSETPAPADPVFVDGYYITGKINGEAHWADLDGTAYSLPMTTVGIDEKNDAELLQVDLKAGDEVRAVKVENKEVHYYQVNGVAENANYVAAVDGKYDFYLGKDGKLYVTAPEASEPVLAEKDWYLVGKFGGEEKWEAVAANKLTKTEKGATDQFVYQYKISQAFVETDEFKIIGVEEGKDIKWVNDLESNVTGMHVMSGQKDNIYIDTAGTYDIFLKVLAEGEYSIWAGAQA